MALEAEKLTHRGLLIRCCQTWLPIRLLSASVRSDQGRIPFLLGTECPSVLPWQIIGRGGQGGGGMGIFPGHRTVEVG